MVEFVWSFFVHWPHVLPFLDYFTYHYDYSLNYVHLHQIQQIAYVFLAVNL
jgi:hypothetical protein